MSVSDDKLDPDSLDYLHVVADAGVGGLHEREIAKRLDALEAMRHKIESGRAMLELWDRGLIAIAGVHSAGELLWQQTEAGKAAADKLRG